VPAPEPVLLGVVNLSPESMVEDSVVRSLEEARARAHRLCAEGASMVDLGGRSVTPEAPRIDDALEQARLEPVVRALAAEGLRVSVDTWSPDTAVRALGWGARLVNFTAQDLPDPLLEACAAHAAPLVVTYMPYGDAYAMRERERERHDVPAILDYMGPRIERARSHGVPEVIVDPNVGILPAGLTDAEKIHGQLELLWRLDELRALGCPLLLYAARKPERLARILMASAVLLGRPDYVRTHDPALIAELQRAARERARR